ncbi:MAG: alkaline phosphatase family protein [Prevotella sp.]|nr:alkaline phosphatase family protein [Prevotella sp.]
MFKKVIFLFVLLACAVQMSAQNSRPEFGERPKLVVGIVVDQMRWDYLSRYYEQFGEGGFRRLIGEGFSYDNCLINYVPTVTAIGHTSVYTGTTPAFHGICGNNFYIDNRNVYCCTDTSVQPVGSDNKKDGQMSPRNLLATTIGDQLRLHTDFRSKVIGVSYKDRAAILPAGRSANAAYWLDKKNRRFITSTYYMNELPQWVKDHNKALEQNAEFKKVGKDVGLYPLCGHITTDMAIAALKGEHLGQGDVTDMLCVSFSETDVIGHEWGTRGEHTNEAYLELDKDLARLLTALDEQVGVGHYLAFLTADHGAAHNWKFMQDHQLSAGPWSSDGMKSRIYDELASDMGDVSGIIGDIMDYRIFMNWDTIRSQGLITADIVQQVLDCVRMEENVTFAAAYRDLATTAMPPVLRDRALLGYYPGRSGDIIFFPKPGYYEFGKWSSPVGTTHGEWNPYDAHIPMLFYGWHVPHGSSPRETHITDFAATVCAMLHIQQPNACIGEALTFE